MRNPLIKRIPREFRNDLGKYLAIFLFMTLFIGMISGFLVVDSSFLYVYERGFTEQKIEDGHFALNREAPAELLEQLSKKGSVTIHPYFYFEEEIKDTEKNIRVYSTERELNLLCVLSGSLPSSADEIALDRMFAQNNDIAVGDTVTLRDKPLTVTGFIASPDYSCLFENSSDMMFDSINFSVAVMSEEGFDSFGFSRITYNYAWQFPQFIPREDATAAKEMSDDFTEVFTEVLTEYNTELYMSGSAEPLEVTDLLPRYLNQAINFVGEDMGGDKIMFLVFDYILTVVLAFVFAITVSSTITAEAGVIGTLRASGYTRGELLSHYIVLPVLVTLIAAVIGNILGYTVFCGFFVDLYYGSYSLAAYEPLWSAEAFLLTTLIPIIIMLVINVSVIAAKLRLSPLKFIRRDLSRSKRRKAIRLNTKIPFISRFRLRIILQNIPNYITMFCGIFIGGVLVVFGVMFGPLLDDYKDVIVEDRICDYQYVLTEQTETSDNKAEKYAVTSLKTTDERFMEEDISIYGIEADSSYVSADISDGRLLISNGMAAKYSLDIGDTLTLSDPYNSKLTYDFTVDGIHEYNSGLAMFMLRGDFCEYFGKDANYFTGYFSNKELSDIDDGKTATVITISDMTKASDQLTTSLGEMMGMLKWLGVVVFCLLMYIMSKQIIEKNANAISMTKILGFSNGEIGGLYIIATSVVVVLSLLVSMPIIGYTIEFLFNSLMYTRMTGYIPFSICADSYIQMFVLGICSYALVAVIQMCKISRIPKSDALKNVE